MKSSRAADGAAAKSTRPKTPPRRKLLLRLVVVSFSLLLALGVAEFLLRLLPIKAVYLARRNVVQQWSSESNPHTDYRSRPGYRGVFANREFRTRVEINSLGLRGPELTDAGPGERTLLVLGDSFAFGWGVEAHESAPALLEARLRGWRVVNSGTSGWGTRQQLAFLRHYGLELQPDAVLLMYVPNDPAENLLRYRVRGGRLTWDEPAAGWAVRLDRALATHSAVWTLIRRLSQKAGITPRDPGAGGSGGQAARREQIRLLDEMVSLCRSAGLLFYMAYVPGEDGRDRPVRSDDFAWLVPWATGRGVEFFDLTPPLQTAHQNGVRVYFHLDDHWTRAGHEVAADALAQHLAGELRER